MQAKVLLPLIYFACAIFIFEVLNWYGTKYIQATWVSIAKYALMTLSLQFIAYVSLVWGLNLSYKQLGDIWSLIITTTAIAWLIKITTAYAFFQKLPTIGKIVGLILLVIANVIDKFWK